MATGLGLRQDEPQVDGSAEGKGVDLDSRLGTPLTVVVVVAQGKVKYFWPDIHDSTVLALALSNCGMIQGATVPDGRTQ